MSYIIGEDRNQVQFVSVSLDDLIDQNNSVRVIDAYVDSLDLVEPDEMAVLADTGYYNGPEIKNCVDAGMTVYIKKGKSNNKTKESRYRKEEFVYDPERDVYTCPEGKIMPFFERRGIENVDAECASMFIAYNLKRLFGMLSVTELKKKFETCRA